MARPRTVRGGKFEITKILDVIKSSCGQVAAAVRQQCPDFDEDEFILEVMDMLREKCSTPKSEVTASAEDADQEPQDESSEEVANEGDETEEVTEDSPKAEPVRVESNVQTKLAIAAFTQGDERGALKHLLVALRTGEIAEIAFDEDEIEEEVAGGENPHDERAEQARALRQSSEG